MPRVAPAPAEQVEPLFGPNAPLRLQIYAQRPPLAAAFVEQVDGKRFEGDEPLDQARDLFEQFLEVQNAGNLPSEIEQRGDDIVFGHDLGARNRRLIC